MPIKTVGEGGSDWHLRTQGNVIPELPEWELLYSDALADSVTCYQELRLTQTTYHQNETCHTTLKNRRANVAAVLCLRQDAALGGACANKSTPHLLPGFGAGSTTSATPP